MVLKLENSEIETLIVSSRHWISSNILSMSKELIKMISVGKCWNHFVSGKFSSLVLILELIIAIVRLKGDEIHDIRSTINQ